MPFLEDHSEINLKIRIIRESIAVFIELVQVVEVEIVLYAFPDVVGGVGFFLRETVGTKEYIAWIDQIFHERETDLVALQCLIIEIAVTPGYLFLRHIL